MGETTFGDAEDHECDYGYLAAFTGSCLSNDRGEYIDEERQVTGNADGAREEMMMHKTQEPVDSAEWEQTQERRCGSQQGLNLMGNTDSPDSVVLNRGTGAADTTVYNRQMHEAPEQGHRIKTDGGSAMETEHLQMGHPQQMGRVASEGRDLSNHPKEKAWERRGGAGGGAMPAPGYGSQGYHAYPGHGGAGVETPFRQPESRITRGSGMPEMQGSLDSSAWGTRMASRAPPAGMSRMHSDTSGLPMSRLPHSRHSFSEMYDGMPRGMDMNMHMDGMYGEPVMSSPQGDVRRGHRRSTSNGVGMPQLTPPRRMPTQDFHSPQQPGTPSEATRKRRRGEAYPQLEPSMGQEMSGYEGMDMAPRGSRHQQEQLIYTLKQQIDILDQQTQSLLKDTLYRISRNANAANGVAEPSFRTSQRNAFLDKVVANFMYNRFSPSAPSRHGGLPPSSRYSSNPPYMSRASSSPVPFDASKQSLHIDP